MGSQCLFCEIVQGTSPAHVVQESAGALAFLDRYPINPGHTLVVPKRHSDDVSGMTEEDAAAVFALVHKISGRIRDVFGPDQALNVLMSTGAAADQSVFHSHVHLIPRNPGDGFAFVEVSQPAPTDVQLGQIRQLLHWDHPAE
jgi:histidine triad (HIT) family protein